MTEIEFLYIKSLLDKGLLQSPLLEMGVGYDGPNCKAIIEDAGIRYYGTDITQGHAVDYMANFEDSAESIAEIFGNIGLFGTVLCPAVLEHLFEPIKVLDNIVSILKTNGNCVIVAPIVWPIHNYPIDCYRYNPDFFREYCKRRSLRLLQEHFVYLGRGKISEYKNHLGADILPKPVKPGFQDIKSRAVHKIFNTFGRGMFFPSNLALGVVIQKR